MSARIVALSAALLAALPAQAYQQTRSQSNPAVGLRWTTSTVPWFLNTIRPASSPSCQASGTTDPAADAVQAGFAAWQGAKRAGDAEACSGIKLPYAGTSDSVVVGGNQSEHLVVFREGWCSTNADAVADSCYYAGTCANKYNCFDDVTGGMSRNVLALTTVIYSPSNGAIADADMEVVDWGGAVGAIRSPPADGWYWTCFDPSGQPTCTSYGQDACSFMDLQNTVTHEAGHFIGLAHPCESDSATASRNGVPVCAAHPEMAPVTMYPSASPGETSKRTLAPDDVEGVCAVYGAVDPSYGIAVSREALSFGAVELGTSGTQTFTVSNTGALTLTGTLSVTTGTGGGFTVSPSTFSIPAGGPPLTVTVVFAPPAVGPAAATVVITSNVPTYPTVNVSVTGTGLAAPIPIITLTPAALSFGNVVVGTTATLSTEVRNTGTSLLIISTIERCTSTSAELSWAQPLPLAVPPAVSVPINITYAPTGVGHDVGCIVFSSNAPSKPMTILAVDGAGEVVTASSPEQTHSSGGCASGAGSPSWLSTLVLLALLRTFRGKRCAGQPSLVI